ncbi:hypothetical protein ACFOZ0_03980 [Streptomyces yaanensis]|uniref:Uncharacterized protein n=1 Tax=Streptomyces yaanensis TaxID=1142239 RepID=A0ABV7SAL3_9ACTN|nr:hypothetical protein [Streptomyces sp. CGMCC 4.7035]WNC00025.1 hypothetical protein Q2K21_19200 [Streptomyces sp. CGMCC 4.7035]
MQERQWSTARRSELDALAEQLTKQVQEVQVKRDELAVVERVLSRSSDYPAQHPYNAAGTSALNDVTSGSNGSREEYVGPPRRHGKGNGSRQPTAARFPVTMTGLAYGPAVPT